MFFLPFSFFPIVVHCNFGTLYLELLFCLQRGNEQCGRDLENTLPQHHNNFAYLSLYI